MSRPAPAGTGIGDAAIRREDADLITGDATFTDDLSRPDAVHLAFHRSQHAHATIDHVDTDAAAALDGVIGVFTAADLAAADTPPPGKLPAYGPPDSTGERLPEPLFRPVLAEERVRHVGEPIAGVVAVDRYTAHEAADLIRVGYSSRETVVSPTDAMVDGSPTIHDSAPDNVAFVYEVGDEDAVETRIADADTVVSMDIGNQRLVGNPIEPRAALAEYDRTDGRLTVTASTQFPHAFARDLSAVLGMPLRDIRVTAPSVGGAFGTKKIFPEEVLTAWLSRELERPVKWQATRSEGYLSDPHGRGLRTEAELALDADGRVLGVRVEGSYDVGAYVSCHTGIIAETAGYLLTGQYDFPASFCRVTGAVTNTTPVDAYRGVTETEIIQALERLMDRAARELDLDPAELRRRNFVPPDAFPYAAASGGHYDSGDYEPAFDLALERIGYDRFRERQSRQRAGGVYPGIGIACWVEVGGLGPASICGDIGRQSWEYGDVRVDPSGEVTVFVGTADHGQGHATVYGQIVADKLGVAPEAVNIVQRDTDRVPEGLGSYASRSAAVGGGAVAMSVDGVIEKARRIAAHELEVAEDDLTFDDGEFQVLGAPDRSMTIQAVAEAAHFATDLPDGMEPGLTSRSYYDPENFTWAFGTHIATVEVDADTGDVEITDYVAVEDCGTQLNPAIVEGQVHGGVAQGVGQALYEGVSYDENGQLLTASHGDYTVPKAVHVPEMQVGHTVTPSPHNPLGVKGVGESGTIAAPAAVVNAVEDALAPFDVDPMTPPLTPETVWRAIHEG